MFIFDTEYDNSHAEMLKHVRSLNTATDSR